MRALVIVSLLAMGCGRGSSTEGGRLVCKTDGKTYEARVPPGALSVVRDRADQAQLTDCRFVAGAPVIERWPIETAELLPPPPPPDLDDLSGGVVGGVLTAPPPPPPPASPMNIPPSVLENNRIAGLKQIEPDPATQLEIRRSGKDKIIGSFKLCVAVDGEISTVSQLKSTGFADYDAKIITGLKTWRYMPYIYNGGVVPVCTAVTFIYSTPQ